MTKFNPSQLTYIGTCCADIVAKIRKDLDRPEQDAGVKPILEDIGALIVVYGRPGMALAIRGWCDMAIAATPGAEIGRPVEVKFAAPDHSELVSRNKILPERQWCADVMAARFAADEVRVYNLIDKLPKDRLVLLYMYRLAEMVAGLLNAYEAPAAGAFPPGLYRRDTDGNMHRKIAAPD